MIGIPKIIVLSRKGFDREAGGCASPIFSDGRMASIPIPENTKHPDVTITFRSLPVPKDGHDDIVCILKSLRPQFDLDRRVHLDPDIRPSLRSRTFDNSLGYFGQDGKDQTELQKWGACEPENNVLFLFYGWFKGVTATDNGKLRYATARADDLMTHDQHLIWGWLQSDGAPRQILSGKLAVELQRASHHPHIEARNRDNNYLFVGRERLSFANCISGWGVFQKYNPGLRLSCGMELNKRSLWRLPSFFRPMAVGRIRNAPWTTDGDCERVMYRGYGQEFIFNTEGYEAEASSWLHRIFRYVPEERASTLYPSHPCKEL